MKRNTKFNKAQLQKQDNTATENHQNAGNVDTVLRELPVSALLLESRVPNADKIAILHRCVTRSHYCTRQEGS